MLRSPGHPGGRELAEGMRLLDRYTILDRIGSGGMATIYRATDDRLDRVVCIKLLRTLIEGSGSDNTSGRAVYEATYTHFLQEALALSKLQHPNTLRIYDFGYLDDASPDPGAPFHVSEYLDGGNLETHVRLRGPIPADEALGILEGIGGALAEAHEHGIIHRDIKPSNILFAGVRGELVPKLADFGIAYSGLKKKPRGHSSEPPDARDPRSAHEAEHAARVSAVALFSPRWAAPEQLCGSPEGPRTDVYALGLLATFMLTGSVLFDDDDVSQTFDDRVRSDTLVNARIAQAGLQDEVARVLSHAMVARPDHRIASALELFEDLRTALKARVSTSIAPFPIEPPTALPPSSRAPGSALRPVALSLEVEGLGSGLQPAPERVAEYGERRLRFVQVHEKLDLSFAADDGGVVRLRVTMLPSSGATPKLNVKGLTGFVALRGQRPTPALTVSQDGAADLVSGGRQMLGGITWYFGRPQPTGRLFVVDGRQLLVPYSEAKQAVVLMLSRGNDLVVMCRR